MNIHDTLSATEKKLEHNGTIKIYLCGVTVYDESHVGHARTIIIFDVLRRYLEDKGANVEIVQNFTDIDDKIINRAQKEHTTAESISIKYINDYFEDFDRLNVKRATIYPRATKHMDDIIRLIKELVERQFAYTTENGVYFAVSKFPEYGKLSKKDIKELQSGARIKVDDAKNDPLDFALWKFTNEEPTWQSPWGRGRPGWHIECSAMSVKYLGANFDIHGGGRDLIFPHHENEIAQSESYSGSLLAKIWMHVGMITTNGEKMSKSLGNIKSIRQALNKWGPNVIRLFCLSGHYSKPIDYTDELLGESLARWRLAEACHHTLIHAEGQSSETTTCNMVKKCAIEFDTTLECDLNTHSAISSFFLLIRETNHLAAEGRLGANDARIIRREFDRMLYILGLNIQNIPDIQRKEINNLVITRDRLRREKKFKEADEIRDQLEKMSIELVDNKGKTVWIKREIVNADV